MSSDFDFGVIYEAIPFLFSGMGITLLLTIVAIIGGIIIGTLLALMKLSPFFLLQKSAQAYVNFFRSMPLILVIFWFYFLLPMFTGKALGGLTSVLIAFTMFEAAYYCEIIRAGIQSIRSSQIQAGKALGLTYPQNMYYIILPQAFRNMIPVLLTQAIVLFQDTSLVYVVGIKDFLTSAELVSVREMRPIEMFTTAAVVYFVICLSGSIFVKRLQDKFERTTL
jgi:glutamate/aspartate transport system permease protein